MSAPSYCAKEHQNDITLACLSQNKKMFFCQKCFASHKCQSMRCGNLKKLNSYLSRNIEELRMKNKLEKIGADAKQTLSLYDRYIRQFTAHMITQIEMYIPLILISKLSQYFTLNIGNLKQKNANDQEKNELVDYEFKKLKYSNIKKSTKQYPEAIKQIVNTIKQIQSKKAEPPKEKIALNRSRQDILKNLNKQFPKFLEQLTGTRAYFFDKLNQKFDDFIIENTKDKKFITYMELEKFKPSQFDKLNSLRYNIDFNIIKLEQYPQSLLAFCKNILRQQTFINFKKQQIVGFAYSEFLPISTTVDNNRQLQQLFLDVEAKMVEQIKIQTNPSGKHFKQQLFELSQKIIIMGPQLTVIYISAQGKNKQFLVHRLRDQKYKQSKQRQQIYGMILSKLGLKSGSKYQICQVRQIKKDIRFKEQIDKIYCFFYISACILKGDVSVLDIGNSSEGVIENYIKQGRQLLKKQISYIRKNQQVNLY